MVNVKGFILSIVFDEQINYLFAPHYDVGSFYNNTKIVPKFPNIHNIHHIKSGHPPQSGNASGLYYSYNITSD